MFLFNLFQIQFLILSAKVKFYVGKKSTSMFSVFKKSVTQIKRATMYKFKIELEITALCINLLKHFD